MKLHLVIFNLIVEGIRIYFGMFESSVGASFLCVFIALRRNQDLVTMHRFCDTNRTLAKYNPSVMF